MVWKLEGDNRNDLDILEKVCKDFEIKTVKNHSNNDFEDKFIKAKKWYTKEK